MKLGFVICGMLLAASNAYAGDRQVSLDWLKVIAFAAHQTNYTGIFIYQYGNRVETSRITHVVGADSEYERLEGLDGPRREIIRHHGQVWRNINHKMVQVGSQQGRARFPSLLPEQLSALAANYQVEEVGTERVDGYNTQVILFQPNDELRFKHKMWVHTDSGLLLKAAVLGHKNQVIEQYAFTQLQIGGNIDTSWIVQAASGVASSGQIANGSPRIGAGQGTTTTPPSAVLAAPPVESRATVISPVNSGWVADALPPGFKKIMEIKRPMFGKHDQVTQMVFSDGLSSISIFIEPNDGDKDDTSGLASRGAVNLYHKSVDKHLFTVVGDVPPRTVMRVLDSVRYNGK